MKIVIRHSISLSNVRKSGSLGDSKLRDMCRNDDQDLRILVSIFQ